MWFPPLPMPDMMGAIIGRVIDALAIIGGVGLVFALIKGLRRTDGFREVAAQSSVDQNLRHHIDEQAKRQQTAIERAVNGDDPADELADLGNLRRE